MFSSHCTQTNKTYLGVFANGQGPFEKLEKSCSQVTHGEMVEFCLEIRVNNNSLWISRLWISRRYANSLNTEVDQIT